MQARSLCKLNNVLLTHMAHAFSFFWVLVQIGLTRDRLAIPYVNHEAKLFLKQYFFKNINAFKKNLTKNESAKQAFDHIHKCKQTQIKWIVRLKRGSSGGSKKGSV